MRLLEIQKIKNGVFVYSTKELVNLINSEMPGLGSEMYRHGYFDIRGSQDSIIYQIEQVLEDNFNAAVPFDITDIVETHNGRLWHVIDNPK